LTLGIRLTSTARSHPRRVAIQFEGRRISYRELEEASEGFAAGLVSLGIGPGDKVALLLPNSPEFAVAYFGTVKAGAAAVPLNTYLTAPELDYILKDSAAKALVASAHYAEKVDALNERPGHVLVTDGTLPGATPISDITVKGDGVQPFTDEGAPAAVLYTSGTTGHPKGAVLTHGNLLANAASCAVMFKVTHRDRFLLFLPMFHAFSFLVCMLLPVTAGARSIVLTSVKPFNKVIKAIVFGRATFFVAIPAVYNLLSEKKFPRVILRLLALRLCVSGAAPLPAEVLERFSANYPFPLLEGYGLTEASPVVSCNPLDGVRKAGSVGIPVPGVEVRAVDGGGAALPAGEVGEIAVRGPNVMKGYLGNEEATKEAIKDGWLFTGDMGYIDRDGYIFIVDRKKDLILVHGMNVYPREVEEAIYRHPLVKEAAVVGIPDLSHGEVPKAFVSLKDGASLSERELKRYLRERLASYKVPRQVEFRKSLPTSPTGKVLKRELKVKAGG